MKIRSRLSVAVPWSLTHYIPLNGFHPLYQALFDERPGGIQLNAIDNVKLSKALQSDELLRQCLVRRVRSVKFKSADFRITNLGRRYCNYFDRTNFVLTELLPGQVEFHHTAPFPSLRRPFVFHCESFLPVFYPSAHQGTRPFRRFKSLREQYSKIFSMDECLGIFSHIPETLSSLSRFFGNSLVDRKLLFSHIGISKHAFPIAAKEKLPLSPTFRALFINSAHQNPASFFLRGGHIVLRFWKELRQRGTDGRLYMRCCRPTDDELVKNGVDTEFVKVETGRSVIWIENYLSNKELNALMGSVHFMLLPSASLHSVSIMQAMALGTIPVVTDTVGTSRYVLDDEDGIVLKGVRRARWFTDPHTDIELDHFSRDETLDASLIAQLTARVLALLQSPDAYERIRSRAMNRATKNFSGSQFSEDFWGKVGDLYERYKKTHPQCDSPILHSPSVGSNLVTDSDWSRLFEGPTQPTRRLSTEVGRVSEHSGGFIHTSGTPLIKIHDWSPVRAYIHWGAPRLQFSTTIKGLEGKFLESKNARLHFIRAAVIRPVSRFLRPYPTIYKFCAQLLDVARRSHRAIFLVRR